MADKKPIMQWVGNGKVWATQSASRPNLYHFTIESQDGVFSCTCEGWRSHKKCWHVTEMAPTEPDDDFQVSL